MGTGIVAGLWMVGVLRTMAPVAADTPAVRRAYRRAMQLELDFFDAAARGWSTVAAE